MQDVERPVLENRYVRFPKSSPLKLVKRQYKILLSRNSVRQRLSKLHRHLV